MLGEPFQGMWIAASFPKEMRCAYDSNGLFAGSGASYPRRRRKAPRCCSILANFVNRQQTLSRMGQEKENKNSTHNTSLLPLHHPILNPNSITAHQIRHHDICRQPIPNHSNLLWSRDSRLGVLEEVLHDFGTAAGFLGAVREDVDAC